jgi:hypothetical protein
VTATFGRPLKGEPPKAYLRATEGTLEAYLSRPHVDAALRSQIAGADVILLPVQDDANGPVFAERATDLFRELRLSLQSTRVEIAVHDADYRERLLRSIIIDLGIIFVTYAVIPMLPNALWDYVKKRTGAFRDSTTKFRLLVAKNETGTITEVSYDGPTEAFEKTMAPLLVQLTESPASVPVLPSGDRSAEDPDEP